MKTFEITLSGVAKKVFTVVAKSREDAIKQAHNIYLNTNLIDFTSEDIDTVFVTHVEEKSEIHPEKFCDGNCDHCPYGLKSECEDFKNRAETRNQS